MARNHPKKNETNQDSNGEQPPMQGGTPGVVIPDGDKRLSPTAVVSNGVIGSARRTERTEDAPAAREYTVVGGPVDSSGNIMVMYGRVKTKLPRGKVVSEASVDIEALVKQGVQLREIVPLPPPPEPVVEEDENASEQTGTEG